MSVFSGTDIAQENKKANNNRIKYFFIIKYFPAKHSSILQDES
nr:MAG TPA: hypothetical protein [Caudoviricetes sp.]